MVVGTVRRYYHDYWYRDSRGNPALHTELYDQAITTEIKEQLIAIVAVIEGDVDGMCVWKFLHFQLLLVNGYIQY